MRARFMTSLVLLLTCFANPQGDFAEGELESIQAPVAIAVEAVEFLDGRHVEARIAGRLPGG